MSTYTRVRGLNWPGIPGGQRAVYYGIAVLLGALVGGLALFVPPLYLLFGIGGLFFVYLLFYDIDLAVVVALLLLEQLRDYNYLGGGSPFHPNGLMGLALIFGALWFFAFNKIQFSRLTAIRYFLGFLVASFLSLLFAGPNWFEGLTIALRLASGFAIYVILIYRTDSIKKVGRVIAVVLLALLWPTVVGLVAIAQGKGDPFMQLGTARLGGGSSGFGVYLAMLLPICLVFAFDARTAGKRILWGALSLVFLVGLFYSYGRSGWIGFTAGLVVLAALKYKKLWFLIPGLVLIAVLVLPQLSERFSDISLSQLGNRNSSTLAMRIQLWDAGFQVFKQSNPIFGVGYGVERYRIGAYLSQYAWMAHNDYVAVLVGTGLLGFFFFVLWHGQWLVKLLAVYRQSTFEFDKSMSLATFTVLVVSLVVRLTDNLVESTGRLYPLVALVAVTLALPRIRAAEAARDAAPARPQEEAAGGALPESASANPT